MTPIEFTPTMISGVIAVLLSVAFAYIPKLRIWFAGLVSQTKSYIMLGLLIFTSVIIYLLAYYGILVTSEPVTVVTLIQVILTTIATNQGTYLILPEARDVVTARNARG